MQNFKISRWTRSGIINFDWNDFETFERLTINESIRAKLMAKVSYFQKGKDAFHKLKLPWRASYFFFGASGTGKTAASKALAQLLEWDHFTIPAHEILDAHALELAFKDAVSTDRRVIVLEEVDRMIQTMETEDFFQLLDHTLERAEATFWIATTRHADQSPKIQLIRPGRFDEAIRFDFPNTELRSRLFNQLLESLNPELLKTHEALIPEWVEQSQNLTFSHFEELRRILVVKQLEGTTEDFESGIPSLIQTFMDDQMIAGDRWGGLSDSTEKLQERVSHMDGRVLTAALDMTDVLRKLMEKVIGDAASSGFSDTTEKNK